MRKFLVLAASAIALTACGQKTDTAASGTPVQSGGGGSRAQVWAAGSSTVFPFATRVAETVSKTTGGAAAKVESLGTGGGFKLFCQGAGAGFPDIANASRRMKKSEWDKCQAAGVTDIVEIKIGFDGIVLANAKASPNFKLTREQIYRALAAEVPAGAAFAPNPAKTWSAVDKTLPAAPILVYGPPPTSGTRDAFSELAMEKGGEKIASLAALKNSNEDDFKAKTHKIRSDGAWIDSGENDNAIVQTLEKTPNATGVFGYSFLEENMDKVKAATVDGVAPTFETISSGAYPLSRSLYIYVKKANIGVTPGLREYLDGFTSDGATGKGGYLQQRGLIPLPPADHDAQKVVVKALTLMTAPKS